MSAKETQASKGVVLAGLLVSSDRYRFVRRSSCANAELKELAHSLKILWLAQSKLHGWNLSRTCVVCSFEAFRKLRRPAMDSLFPQVLVMIPRFGLWQDKSWQRKSLATYLGLLKPCWLQHHGTCRCSCVFSGGEGTQWYLPHRRLVCI